MPSSGIPKQSPTTGLVVVRPPAAEVVHIQTSSSLSEEVDYSGNGVDCTYTLHILLSHMSYFLIYFINKRCYLVHFSCLVVCRVINEEKGEMDQFIQLNSKIQRSSKFRSFRIYFI